MFHGLTLRYHYCLPFDLANWRRLRLISFLRVPVGGIAISHYEILRDLLVKIPRKVPTTRHAVLVTAKRSDWGEYPC